MNNYWFLRLAPAHDASLDSKPAHWSVPRELAAKVRPGHRIVLATWDEPHQVGRVRAFGVCASLAADTTVLVEWSEADTVFKPNSAGMTHWRTKEFFRFAPAVVERYCLDDLFAEHLGTAIDTPRAARVPASPTSAPRRSSSWNRTPGHIYVLKSPYGYKIGKTVNMRDRLRLFGVKLPFVNSLEYSFYTDDYTAAERSLHQQFASKRLEGEWFSLDAADLDCIRRSPLASAAPGPAQH